MSRSNPTELGRGNTRELTLTLGKLLGTYNNMFLGPCDINKRFILLQVDILNLRLY